MKSHTPNLSLGIDIEDIKRFKEKPYGTNMRFYQKIFSKQEIEYCLSKKNPYPHFAVRFCAKEAFIKAASTKISSSPAIEVILEGNKPFVVFAEVKYTVSLSHEREKAIAIVLL